MAKRRKDIDEEDIDFRLPKFDEEKFVRKEKEKIKITFIAFIFGIFVSIISFGFWVLLHGNNLRWMLVLLFALFTISWLKYIFIRLNINLEDVDKKGMLGVYSTYFFTWLILLIVLVNPPFYDDSPPLIELVTLPTMQEPGGTVEIIARITDNAGIQNISFSITDENGTTIEISPSEYTFNNSIFQYTFHGPTFLDREIRYNYTLTVKDISGYTSIGKSSFWYSNDALKITSSKLTDLLSGDTISITADSRIAPWNFRIYYQLDNGSEINVNRKNPSDKERYLTTPEYEGWEPLKNYTLTLHAEVRYYFENLPIEFSNIVTDTTIYYVSTGDDNSIGKEPPLVEYNYTRVAMGKKQLPNTLNYKLPHPTMVQVPGFNIVLIVSAIAITGFIFKYRKKDRYHR